MQNHNAIQKSFCIFFLIGSLLVGCDNKSEQQYVLKMIAHVKNTNNDELEKIKYSEADTTEFGYPEAKKINNLINHTVLNINNHEKIKQYLDSIEKFSYKFKNRKEIFDNTLYSELLLNNFYTYQQKELELLELKYKFLTSINSVQFKGKYCFDYVKVLVIDEKSKQEMSDGDLYILVSDKNKSIKGIINGDSLVYSAIDEKLLRCKKTNPLHSYEGTIYIPQPGSEVVNKYPIRQ